MIKKMTGLATAAMMLLTLGATPAVPAARRVKATADRTWSPDFRHITPGNRIVWKNPTDRVHTVTAYGGNWSKDTRIPEGGKTSKKFRSEGTFRFRCTIHSTLVGSDCSGMCGTIHVAN